MADPPAGAASGSPPPDEAARRRIGSALDTTLFVEAGAGSGKTTALIDRVMALVARRDDPVELRSVAAITFTDKAAAELRDRLRQELERRLRRTGDEGLRPQLRTALEQLDGAAIGTLHAFAQRVLSEHPVEAGLPPRVEVLDEVASAVAFEQRWAIFQDELLEDGDLERTILMLLASGARWDALRVLAQAFDDNWDLVEERVPVVAPALPSVRRLYREARDTIAGPCGFRCFDPGDGLGRRLGEIGTWLGALDATEDDLELLALLGGTSGRRPSFKVGRTGRRTAFDDVEAVREAVRRSGEAADDVCAGVSQACATRLASAVRRFTVQAAAERRAAGQLQFHDLLVLARAVLRDPAHGATVRARLHDRYRHLLLDEFQDTDPIQIDLAVRIAAAHAGSPAAGSAPWDAVDVSPGHLFVVGDPKQSIYRFRRADIATFIAAERRFGPEGGGVVELTANFRSVAPVIDWVNATFAALMSEPDDVAVPGASQATYVPLRAVRTTPPPVGPAVSVLGRSAHPRDVRADGMRAAEADDVATTVRRALTEQWAVDDGRQGWRPARLGDITVLVPARTSLPFLEGAFDRAGVAYRAESSSLVYASRAVRDLLMVLRAVDDPTNHLHVVAALRTPLLGCGDDDLFRFKVERGGRWDYLGNQPERVPADDPVAAGLAYLAELNHQRTWLAPSELLGRVTADRRAMELGFAQGRPRDVWRRLRFVIDQARAWTEATGGTLRQYLQWVRRQTAEGARVAESILPESDDDAVRIMTIHSAKGLEFPITIVSGMSTKPHRVPAAADVLFPPRRTTVGYRFGPRVRTDEYTDFAPIDEQMGLHERVRLLYVACTRARDHLVLSLHRPTRAGAPAGAARTNAELVVDGIGGALADLPDAAVATAGVPTAEPPPPGPLEDFDRWDAERRAALRRAAVPTAVSATALTEEGAPDGADGPDPGLAKRPLDLDLPPWRKGRYGTAVGRAVHGVLQTVDLATGAGLDAAVAAQCEAEAVPDRGAEVGRLVQAALGSPAVLEAAAAVHWREIYACTPLGDRLLEGYVDLLYRSPGGLVVVDYKTADTADPEELGHRVEGYRIQGASYALAVGATAGEPVVRVVFVFLTRAGAIERALDGLDAGMEEVRRLVAAGEDLVTE